MLEGGQAPLSSIHTYLGRGRPVGWPREETDAPRELRPRIHLVSEHRLRGQPEALVRPLVSGPLGSYEGIILSFFKTVPAARASLKSLAWLYGGKLFRNVVVTWDQKSVPSRSVRNTVRGCLRSRVIGEPAPKRPPPATGCRSRRLAGAATRERRMLQACLPVDVPDHLHERHADASHGRLSRDVVQAL